MTRVRVSSPLFSYTGNRPEVEAEGATLDELLADLDARYPGLRFRVVDELGAVRRHIKLFIDAEHCDDLQRPVPPTATVHVITALSGG